ncbi:MAG: hypothetical protein AB7K68_16810 [Bacteriovoracia bacterium]
MVEKLRNAVGGRVQKNREALLQRLEGELDGVYDFIYQVFAEEETAVKILRNTLRSAVRRAKNEQYERYLRLWAFRIAVENIRPAYRRFLSERLPNQKVPLECLALEEKLALFLHDRAGLTGEEISGVLQVQVGKVGRLLTYAREKAARELLGIAWPASEILALRERVALNQALDLGAEKGTPKTYFSVMRQVQEMVRGLPARRFAEIESSVRSQQLNPILGRSAGVRWQDLSWQYKLGLEASFLGFVGLFAVVVLPWALSRVNVNAFVEGRFAQVLEVESQARNGPDLRGITTDRLLASEGENDSSAATEKDEFAEMDFPSGDGYEAGASPVAPSKQNAAVYRLIVQSPSPQDLIPHVRSVFAQKNVRERDNSGRSMPGGVYFDGITSVGAYPQILQQIQGMGQTKTYSNPGASRNPNERARVIVWVQQI